MSDGHRSFWSSVPGLITGLAGLLTGIVGLITLLVQQGVIGNNNKTTATTTVTTSVTGGTTAIPSALAGSFTLSPQKLDFPPATLKQTMTVKNTGSTPLTVSLPTFTGPDYRQFAASMGDCDHALAANLSCTLQVTFTPVSGTALKQYSATLQVTAAGAARGDEIPVTATTLL